MNEVAVAMSNEKISYNEACDFATKVIDRFRNPFMDHQWLSIGVQYSSKMKMRNIPLLIEHYQQRGEVPEHMALGFAGYLLFMRCSNDNGGYSGQANGSSYPVQDDHVEKFAEAWRSKNVNDLVDIVLADVRFWETDLTSLKGFAEAVKTYLHSLLQNGVMPTLRNLAIDKTRVPS
jgi:tagaturonate reductase